MLHTSPLSQIRRRLTLHACRSSLARVYYVLPLKARLRIQEFRKALHASSLFLGR